MNIPDQLWFFIALAIYVAGFVQAIYRLQKGTVGGIGALPLVAVGFVFHTVFLVLRAIEIRHCPITNAFELLTFSTWAIVGIYVVVKFFWRIRFLSVFILPPVIAIGVAALLLPADAVQPENIGRGVYFGMHVAVMMLAYGVFALAGAAGAMYLLQERQLKTRHLSNLFHQLPSIEKLDRLNLALLITGFVLLTVGIGAGCLWNLSLRQHGAPLHGFDPRIIASSLVWLVYAALLGARWLLAFRGRKVALLSVISSIAVLITLGLTHTKSN
jgi:ABC-type transport system involved in cytochrome c biogenesis permease subunit